MSAFSCRWFHVPVVGLFLFAIVLGGSLRPGTNKSAQAHEHGKKEMGHGMKESGHGMKKKMPMKEMGHAFEEGDKPIIITMEELHNSGGTPPGWRFRIPRGDADDGREAFIKMECFACHNIDGEKFPKRDKDPAKVGPDLSGMGAMHGDGTYFFESIVNPNSVVLKGPGYIKNGLSIMPNYSDSLGLQEAIDLVAYLKSLKGGHTMGGMKMKGMEGHKEEMKKRSGNPCAMGGMKKDAGHGGGMKDMKKH